jgi:hypothetical protein
MPTTNMSLNEPSVGQTSGPDWATETNANWETLDAHDHTSGKGVQLTPSALNINADVEFNQNSATELKNMIFDSSVTPATTSYSVYQSGGDLYWRNGSGTAVQITSGSNVRTTGGSIDGMSGNDSEAAYGSGIFTWQYDSTKTPFAGAKFSHADINLYKYDGSSGSNAYVILKYTGSSAGSNNLTFPDETGTILSTATSFAGAISIATSASNGNISLNPNGTGEVVIGNGSASGKITTNSTQDLVLDTNAGTNSGNITIQDGTNGEITIDTHGTGDINLTAGADVNIPANVGLTFGDNNKKIESNDTNLTLTSTGTIECVSGTLDLSGQTVDVTLNAAVDALNFDSNTLSIDASGNKIGIGTAAPDSKLHVEGTDPGSGNALIEAKLTNNSNYPCLQLINENAGGNDTDNNGLLIDNRGGGGGSYSIRVKNNTTENFYVKADGKIYFGGVIQSDIETLNTKKFKQMGAFMQSSTHQSLVLGY